MPKDRLTDTSTYLKARAAAGKLLRVERRSQTLNDRFVLWIKLTAGMYCLSAGRN